MGNRLIVADLMDAIEKDRPPLGSIYDGRAALEMILAVYESHKLERPVELPMKNRRHPLGMNAIDRRIRFARCLTPETPPPAGLRRRLLSSGV